MFKIGNSICTIGGKCVMPPVNYNPLGLPPNTIRVRTNDGNAPTKGSLTSYETATLVTGTSDVYDVYKSGSDFNNLLYLSRNVIEVLGANTTGITIMSNMFYGCESLVSVPLFDMSSVTDVGGMFSYCASLTSVPLFDTSSVTIMTMMFFVCTSLASVPLFDTSSVTSMSFMFDGCTALTTVPLLDTSNATNVSYMFCNCTDVKSGALALYQQMSTQTNPPSNYSRCFENCGANTVTGAAELEQIPSGWK